ncbi:MAG: tRNA (adenosine(37)-N6)-dimethylallyltransferase MiaA [Bacteroidota bacterium]
MNSTRKNKTLVVIGGPTASGKSAAAAKLALHYHSEVISADARQLYREMKIGTAVPDPAELLGVPHHFLQQISLSEDYNASRYESEVLTLCEELFEKHDVLFLAGGSGLYIDAVCCGIDELPSYDPRIRETLAGRLHNEGLASLRDELKSLDPLSYERIDLNNPMRVLKALEISIQTGRPYSSFLTHSERERPFRILRIALDPGREELYERINSRVSRMMDAGLEEEARKLYPLRHLTALKTVGYRELFSYFEGKTTLEEAVDLIRRNTRKYARKQTTWFRKEGKYRWFLPEDITGMIAWIDEHKMG